MDEPASAPDEAQQEPEKEPPQPAPWTVSVVLLAVPELDGSVGEPDAEFLDGA